MIYFDKKRFGFGEVAISVAELLCLLDLTSVDDEEEICVQVKAKTRRKRAGNKSKKAQIIDLQNACAKILPELIKYAKKADEVGLVGDEIDILEKDNIKYFIKEAIQNSDLPALWQNLQLYFKVWKNDDLTDHLDKEKDFNDKISQLVQKFSPKSQNKSKSGKYFADEIGSDEEDFIESDDGNNNSDVLRCL